MKYLFDPSQETFEEYLRRINLEGPGPGSVINADCKDRPGAVFLIHGKKETNKETNKATNPVGVSEGSGSVVSAKKST